MKVFQIVDGICYWDATEQYPTVESTIGWFPPNVLFVEAEDYVFEGWGYDADLKEFIKPSPPEGWLYDDETGTFYPEGTLPPSVSSSEDEDSSINSIWSELAAAVREGINSY